MKNLDELRVEIDKVDGELRNLFVERMKLVSEIGQVKRAIGAPVYVPDREAAMIERNSQLVDEEFRDLYIEFLKKNLELSREYQSRTK
ncbi:MAG: chorismate mutase [Eubacterium sp.]|nr:chorismate mutase [Eubacterium sp.]